MRAVRLFIAALVLAPGAVSAQPVSIVAAENFYGDVARQIAGPGAAVTSILSNPDEDPHLFEASPSVARAISGARIVVYNGLDYDPWMARLLGAAGSRQRQAIVAAELTHSAPGSNPHLWYDPATMPLVAHALAVQLGAADPAGKTAYEQRAAQFDAAYAPLLDRVHALRSRFAGTPVTATEPVFGYMASALGLVMRNERFQLAVMNDTEPSPSDVVAMEGDLRQHRVRLLIYNSQATDAAARRLLRIARDAKVPVVGVTETEPSGQDYVAWMLGQLATVEKALAAPS